jgi:hypothetical protein
MTAGWVGYRAVVVAVPVVFVGGCGLLFPPDDEEKCTEIPALTVDGIIDVTVPTEPPSYCEIARPYSRHIFTTTLSQHALVDEMAGYDATWTVPADSDSVQDLGSGLDVRIRTTGGEVCGRHENACTPAGDFVCRPLTVLTENVWSVVDGLPTGIGGALTQDEDAVWWLNPVDSRAYGVWRIDKATLLVTQVADTFPEGNVEGYAFQGGAAVAYDGNIHYLAEDGLFLFDTTTHAWRRAGTLPAFVTNTRTTVEHDGRLWGLTPGAFWIYDPTTQTQTQIGDDIALAEGIGFVVQGRVVIGAGRSLTASPDAPESWFNEFFFWDETGVQERYELSLPVAHYTQALDLGDTTILLTHDGPAYVVDEPTRAVRQLEENPALGCARRVIGENYGAYKGTGITFDGIGLVVGGEADTGTGTKVWRAGTFYFP